MAKLLIMEDDLVFSFQLKRDLEGAGHQVELCSNASAAIEELKNAHYDLLISDIIVRENDHPVPDGGIRLVGWARNNFDPDALPIIAMTGAHKHPGMSYVLTTAETVGANASLQKPFHLDDMLVLVNRLIGDNSEGHFKAMGG